MSGWIKLEKNLETDPRVLRMARALEERFVLFDNDDPRNATGFDPCNAVPFHYVTLVCGALARLWMFADSHCRDDDTLDMGADEIDRWLGIPKFCSLMPDDWLVEIDAHRVELPGFQGHNGVIAKKRATTQKRVERHRKRGGNGTPLHVPESRNAAALPDQTRPDHTKTRPEEEQNHVPQERDRGPVETVFQHWRTVHGHPRSQLDPKRRRVIQAALERYSVDDLCESISGYRNSPHHMGQNDRGTVYDDIEIFLRDAKHIDAGLAFHRNPPSNLSALTRKNLANTEGWVPPEMRHAAG